MIYENVEDLCVKNGISIKKLERECGIGNGTIGKWRTQTSTPRIGALQKIAARFGVTVDELLQPQKRRGER